MAQPPQLNYPSLMRTDGTPRAGSGCRRTRTSALSCYRRTSLRTNAPRCNSAWSSLDGEGGAAAAGSREGGAAVGGGRGHDRRNLGRSGVGDEEEQPKRTSTSARNHLGGRAAVRLRRVERRVALCRSEREGPRSPELERGGRQRWGRARHRAELAH
jgi:hypothetical protein